MKPLLNKITGSQAGYAALALRIPIAIIFIAHGTQTLDGLFGGYALTGTGQFMESNGIEP
ncbi:DoxX family membrane protein, partial [Psychromonas aquatilis]